MGTLKRIIHFLIVFIKSSIEFVPDVLKILLGFLFFLGGLLIGTYFVLSNFIFSLIVCLWVLDVNYSIEYLWVFIPGFVISLIVGLLKGLKLI